MDYYSSQRNNANIYAKANLTATITNPGIGSGNLPYNNRLDDPNNLYTPTLGNYNFTVPIPGDYTIEGNLFINGATVDSTKYILLSANVNGTSISMGSITHVNTQNIVSSICFAIKKCAFGDKLSIVNQSTVITGNFIQNAAGLSLAQFRITQRYIP